VTGSSIRIQATVGGTGTADTLVRLDPSLASIQNNLLYFHEVNTGGYGIKIVNPSTSTLFANNLVRTLHTHAISGVGVQLAQSATTADRINNNTVQVRTNTDGFAGYAALQVFSDYNTIDIYAGNTGLSYGARFEASSDHNVAYVGYLQATTPLVNLGVSNVFLPQPAAGAGMLDMLMTGSIAFVVPATNRAMGLSANSLQLAAPVPDDDTLNLLTTTSQLAVPSRFGSAARDAAFDIDEPQDNVLFGLDQPGKGVARWDEALLSSL
jgi:hypothetical protein